MTAPLRATPRARGPRSAPAGTPVDTHAHTRRVTPAPLQIVAALVEVYDEALPCFPPALNPVQVQAKATSDAASTMLDALGQAAASFDNAGAPPRPPPAA